MCPWTFVTIVRVSQFVEEEEEEKEKESLGQNGKTIERMSMAHLR